MACTLLLSRQRPEPWAPRPAISAGGPAAGGCQLQPGFACNCRDRRVAGRCHYVAFIMPPRVGHG
eukprot:1395673-Lingulodinium_polyedra.AAC.1